MIRDFGQRWDLELQISEAILLTVRPSFYRRCIIDIKMWKEFWSSDLHCLILPTHRGLQLLPRLVM